MNKVLTEKQAALKLECSVTTLKRYRESGLISFIQIESGSKVTYREEDIKAFARRFLNPASWAKADTAKSKPRKTTRTTSIEKAEQEAALAELEREWGLKIRRNK